MLFRSLICSAAVTAYVVAGPAAPDAVADAVHTTRTLAGSLCANRPADCLAAATFGRPPAPLAATRGAVARHGVADAADRLRLALRKPVRVGQAR